MKNKNQNGLTHQGWEDYYATATVAAWKEQPDEFLMENMKLFSPSDKPLNILDVACGDGRNTVIWAGNGHIICCNDISDTALRKIQELDLTHQPVLVSGDFTKISLLDSQFDIIQCFDGLPQMPDVPGAIKKMIDLTKPGGSIIFNLFTPNDVAYGEGDQIDKNSFVYKDTLFSFFTMEDVTGMLTDNVTIEKEETKRWQDPPHGEFRPYTHTHEAIFIILKKNRKDGK